MTDFVPYPADDEAFYRVGAALSRLGRATVFELRAAATGDGRLTARRFDRALVELLAHGALRLHGRELELAADDERREAA